MHNSIVVHAQERDIWQIIIVLHGKIQSDRQYPSKTEGETKADSS